MGAQTPAPVRAWVRLEGHLVTAPPAEGCTLTLGHRDWDVVTSDGRLVFELALPVHPPTFHGRLFSFEWRIVADVTDESRQEQRISRVVRLDPAPVPLPAARDPEPRPAPGYREPAHGEAPEPAPLPGLVSTVTGAAELRRLLPQGALGKRMADLVRDRGSLLPLLGFRTWAARVAPVGLLSGSGVFGFVTLAATGHWLLAGLAVATLGGIAFGVHDRLRQLRHVEGEVRRRDPRLEVPWCAALGEHIVVRIRDTTSNVARLRCIEGRAERRVPKRSRAAVYWKWESKVIHDVEAPLTGTGAVREARFWIPRDASPTLCHDGRHGLTWSIHAGEASAPLLVLPLRVPPPASPA